VAGLTSAILGEVAKKSIPAALALLGVLAGIGMYIGGRPIVAIVIGLGIISVILLGVGRSLFWSHPRLARCLIEAWILSPFAVAACLSALAVFAILQLDASALIRSSLDTTGTDPTKIDDVATLIKGSVSGFFAIVLTKDIWEGNGTFSVATQFESASRSASTQLNPILQGRASLTPDQQVDLERLIDALVNPVAPNDTINGWEFRARGKRAAVIGALQPKLSPSPVPPPPSSSPPPAAASDPSLDQGEP
jgi:hypothetical protein